jgi:SAM-dependent methyltransferase
MKGDAEADIARLRAAYAQRDALASARPAIVDPAWLVHVHDLEWQLHGALADAGVALAGARVLDVGTGNGLLLHRLLEAGAASGTGIELIEARAQAARERYPTLDVRVGDASAMPWQDAAFDLVTHFTCLSSVLDQGLRRRIAGEMWRVLRPGGAVVSYDLRPAPAPVAAAGRVVRRRRDERWTPVEALALEEVTALFPGHVAGCRAVSLNAALPHVLRAGRLRTALLSALPPLRSHLLAVVVKR